jgi:hypothetical protein
MTARKVSVTAVKVGQCKSSEFSIETSADIDISDSMYCLAEGKYNYGVVVGGEVMIPAHDERTAKAIAERMAGLIMNVAMEARK